MTEKANKRKIGIIILAAGSSSRLGQPKQLLKSDSEYLVNKVITLSYDSQCDKVYVVLGAEKKRITDIVDGHKSVLVYNDSWKLGMGSSIKKGLKATINDNMDAVIFVVVDQINLQTAVIDNLIKAYQRSSKKIAASSYEETYGIPAIFDRAFYSEILRIDDRTGCKRIIEKHLEDTILIDFPGGEIDVDTEQDLQLL